MATNNLSGIARKMKNLDLCMMTTQPARGPLNSRPMSNNGDVSYKGHSYFFTYEQSQKVKDIKNDPNVLLGFNGADGLFISIAGKAKLITSKAAMQDHWVDSLKQWFKQGLDTPGITLIHVKASLVKYWQKNKQGEIKVKL